MDNKNPAEKSLAELDKLYTEAEQCDAELFTEMRSNLLLISGEHYNRQQSSFFRRIRDSKQIAEQQKLRLTKNHIQKIHKTYANNILSEAPGVGFAPKNENELQDQKSAELHHAVWKDAHERYTLDERIDDWCDDFLGVGEVAVKIFWDPNLGKIKAFEQAVDNDGNPLFVDMNGEDSFSPIDEQMLQPNQPKRGNAVHEGDFVFEDVYGFNLLRAPEAKYMAESPYLIIRKMMDTEEVKKRVPDEEKSKISESSDRTLVVFDPSRGGYVKAKNQTLVKEFYFRPSSVYPNGYFYHVSCEVKIAEGELPGGIYPIVTQACEKIQTTPRGRSPVKQMRPYQAEINRAASKMAEHQITLGDDKVILKNGSKVTAGASLPGVRTISITGQDPTILAGRDGSQYLAYMQSQISELYGVMMVDENSNDDKGQMDPYAMLFRAGSQKKKFSRYVKRFERFLVNIAKTYLALAKIHLPEDRIIYAIGNRERVNISEFKNETDICYQITIDPQVDDLETKMGKQLVLNHLVQYTGANLSKEDLGKMLRLMPYANLEEGFSDLTIDYDSATNDILALDRGEIPPVHQYDEHVYCVRRAVSRMRQPDFKFLPPVIQYNYQQYRIAHEQAETEKVAAIQKAQAGFIPTNGYLVTCDMYVSDPKDPAKTRRARLPYEAVKWLIEKLETQGQSLDELEKMNQGAVAEMSQMLLRSGKAPEGMGVLPE